MTEKAWGGRREGAGRPKQGEIRKRRSLVFFDSEWELIRRKAKENGMSPGRYLFRLAERDG